MFNNAAGRIIGALLLALTTLAPSVLRTVSDAGEHVPPVFTNGSEGGFDPRRGSLCDAPLNVSVATSPHGPVQLEKGCKGWYAPNIPAAGVCFAQGMQLSC